MTAHRLYGVRAAGVAATAEFLGDRLGFEFDERESDYLGVYWVARADGIDVRVVAQPDPEGEPLEAAFADYATLIYVDGAGRATDLSGETFDLGTIMPLRTNGD